MCGTDYSGSSGAVRGPAPVYAAWMRKTSAEYPQELLNLFDQYVHGGIDRRGFLERAAQFAVGGVTAAMLLDRAQPRVRRCSRSRRTTRA